MTRPETAAPPTRPDTDAILAAEQHLETTESGADSVEAALIRTLYRQIFPVIAANFTVLPVVVTALWPTANHTLLVTWGATVVAIALIRVVLHYFYRRRPRENAEMLLWGRLFVVGAAASGFVWGAGAYILFAPDSVLAQTLLLVVAAGLTAGAVSAYASYLPAFLLFTMPVLAPVAARNLAIGDTLHVSLAILLLLYGGLVTVVALNFNQSLAETFRLQEEKSRLLERLYAAHNAVQRASRAKSIFLANMSHELRTPLNAINGFAQIMNDQMFGPLGSDRYRQYASIIQDSGQHILQLIEDVLDLSRIEAGSVKLVESAFDAGEAIAFSADMLRDRAQRDNIILAVDIDKDLPWLYADERRFRQIALNLLTNAVKFTPPDGRVTASARLNHEGDFLLVVEDTGVGIAAEDLSRVMAPFVQSADTREVSGEGLGLGLPLVKLLVDRHGGTLSIDSTPGAGTRVRVRLPASRVVAPPTEEARLSA